jgi:hypothetical protein
MHTVNFWAILVAAVIAFAGGSLWYSPILFGKEWMKLTNMTDKDVAAAKAKGGMWKSYLAQFIASIITFGVLGFIVAAATGVTAADGAFMGFLAWLGFIATDLLGALLWEKKPLRLALIQGSFTLLTLVIGGAIIGAWH